MRPGVKNPSLISGRPAILPFCGLNRCQAIGNSSQKLPFFEILSVIRVTFYYGTKTVNQRTLHCLTKNQYLYMAKINFKPNEDRVLVEPAPAEEKTSSGIIIPDTAKEKPQKGKVVATGEGLKDKPVTVKVGDNILYGKYAGTEITIDGKDYLIMRNSDIFGII
jgi:chaperonin GroES